MKKSQHRMFVDMFRRKSDGSLRHYRGLESVPASPSRQTSSRSTIKVLFSCISVILVTVLISAIRNCNCAGDSGTRISPNDETVPAKKETIKKSRTNQPGETKKAVNQKEEESSAAETNEPPPKPEPKIIDLGTHVEIITR
jgi:hypothetical protein